MELLIVLLVMIGMVAIVWPNLQRPLRRTALSQAAATLRESIDQCRFQAITSGKPIFVNLAMNGQQILTGSFEAFVENLNSTNMFDSEAVATIEPSEMAIAQLSATSRKTDAITTWQLPPSIVVSDVFWSLEPAVEDELDVTGDSSRPASSEPNRKTTSPESAIAALGNTNTVWWLPITATGHSRDASIVLLDTSTNETIKVQYASATGALEIAR